MKNKTFVKIFLFAFTLALITLSFLSATNTAIAAEIINHMMTAGPFDDPFSGQNPGDKCFTPTPKYNFENPSIEHAYVWFIVDNASYGDEIYYAFWGPLGQGQSGGFNSGYNGMVCFWFSLNWTASGTWNVEVNYNSEFEFTETFTQGGRKCILRQIYGENSKEIETLRCFRDNVLSQSPEGRR
jgi:hypothetical protein